MKATHLEEKRLKLTERREKLIARFDKAARSRKNVARLSSDIQKVNEFLESLDRIAAESTAKPGTGHQRYAVSSLFLHESFKKLTADQNEQFFFVTGSEVEGVLVLDQWAEFAHQKRSMMGVTADTKSTHSLLIKLERFKHRLLAHFHSHPGNGAEATQPSGTDENFQKRLESAGHVAVMAVFSRDGFVRFVRLDNNLEIEIYGEGVEKHATGIYHLTNLD
jgi:phage host-nuclease inhibitor protein Gam